MKRQRSSEATSLDDVGRRPPPPPHGQAPERPSLHQLMGCQQPQVVKANGATSAMARAAMALLCRTPASDAPLEWRVHPYPEGAEGARRSVRESECAYVTATIGEFLEWEASSPETSPSSALAPAPAGLPSAHPFASVPRDQFWAYADYKDVRDVFR